MDRHGKDALLVRTTRFARRFGLHADQLLGIAVGSDKAVVPVKESKQPSHTQKVDDHRDTVSMSSLVLV